MRTLTPMLTLMLTPMQTATDDLTDPDGDLDPEDEVTDTGSDPSLNRTDDEDDLWDWGATLIARAVMRLYFAGAYDTYWLEFTNVDTEYVVCGPLVVATDETGGSLYETASCVSTGLDLLRVPRPLRHLRLRVRVAGGCVLGPLGVILHASGDVYAASFSERGFLAGYVTTATGLFLLRPHLGGGPPMRHRLVPVNTTWGSRLIRRVRCCGMAHSMLSTPLGQRAA